MAERRRHVVALNADIVGYSRLIADDADGTTARVAELRDVVDRLVTADGGELTQFVGDNFMALFDDPMSAVKSAIAITTTIESHNEDVADHRRLMFRMGIDEGDITEAGGSHHGDDLNIAARIQAIARPGGISVSARVYRGLDEPALRFRALGPHDMKNIPEPVEVFELSSLPSDGTSTERRMALNLESPTVAVLPVLATEGQVASVAAILRSDILHRLAGMPELMVIDAHTEAEAAAPTTAARYMLEIGVHQIGDAIRLFTTLYDVTTMNVVKSQKWTTTVDAILDLSETIAGDVAHAIEIELVIGEPAGLYAELGDPKAIEDVYLGWYHLRTETPDGWRRALEHFGAVAAAHPGSPYGHVLSGFATWMGVTNDWVSDPDAALTEAWDLAQRGLDAGDPTGMGQTVQAAIMMSRGDAEAALTAMDSVEIIRPTCDITYGLEGSIRRYLGQWEKAVDLLDVAMRLTGINKPWYPTVKACSLLMGHRTQQAADLAEAVLEHQPNNLEALIVLTMAQTELGLDRRARATAEVLKNRFPSVDLEDWLSRNPYQDADLVQRWRTDLTAAGAISG